MRCCHFCSQAIFQQAGPRGKENLSPVADFPLVTLGRVSQHFLPRHLHLRSEVGLSWGLTRENSGPRCVRTRGTGPVGRVDVPCMKCGLLQRLPGPLCPLQSHCSFLVSQALLLPPPTASSLISQHQHSPLGVAAAVTDSWLCSGPFTQESLRAC